MSWVLDPATQVVGVQWGGFKFSISASSLLQWRSPEQSRPQIGVPTVSGQFIGSINILGGTFELPHPEDPRIILASSDGVVREESMEEGTDQICVGRRYQLFYYHWTGNPGDYAPPVYFRDEFAVFDTPEAAQVWADAYVEDWNWILRFGAWPLECVQTEQRPWQAFTVSESGEVSINVSAIRRLMMGLDAPPGTPVPDVILEVFIPGFRQTRTSGTAGVSVFISGPENEVEASMDDVKLFDVSEQDIPAQTLTVTIKPNNEIVVSR
jgi:hypothetical protein